MRFRRSRGLLSAVLLAAVPLACNDAPTSTTPGGARLDGPAVESTRGGHHHQARPLLAVGNYFFHIPADFNGGIFGIAVDNRVSFVAVKDRRGRVSGHFHYVQSAGGEDFIFSGRMTCFEVYDTPVLQRFEDIPPMTHNRAKWGGVVTESNDPTLPAGVFLWFQSIDNGTRRSGYPDVSTLGGFGDNAANEAFCASPNVPNPNFGPHAVSRGNIYVR